MEGSGAVRLEPVVEAMPAEFDRLRNESRAEGYRFLERLSNDWASGAMRFDQSDETLLAAYVGQVLAGIGGITVDPEIPEALRMRRFYVRSAFRRTGIGRAIAETLLESALRKVGVVTLNAGPSSYRFWEALGFVPDDRAGHTHVMRKR